jgi:hypothetical protein
MLCAYSIVFIGMRILAWAKSLGHSRFHDRFNDINYFIISDLILTWYCIYEERDKTSFIG